VFNFSRLHYGNVKHLYKKIQSTTLTYEYGARRISKQMNPHSLCYCIQSRLTVLPPYYNVSSDTDVTAVQIHFMQNSIFGPVTQKKANFGLFSRIFCCCEHWHKTRHSFCVNARSCKFHFLLKFVPLLAHNWRIEWDEWCEMSGQLSVWLRVEAVDLLQ